MSTTKLISFVFAFVICPLSFMYAGNHTWTGTVSTAWNNGGNWSTGQVPGYNDTVTIVSKPNSPVLNDTITLKKFRIFGSTLNLGGHNLTINIYSEFSGGTISNGKVITRGSNTYFQGTTFNCPVDAQTGQVQLNGGKYNSPVYIEQNGTSTGTGTGNNVFNDTVTIRNTGTGYLRLANSTSQPDTFNTTAIFYNSGLHEIQISYTSSTVFNGDVYISNIGPGGISTNTNGNGTTSMATGKTLRISSTGFTSATLLLRNFYQHGTSSPDSLVFGTSSILNIIGSTFESTMDFTAPSILSKTSTYAAVTFRKTANIANSWEGGNTFNGTASIYCNTTNAAGYSLATQSGNTFNGNANFYTTTGVIQVSNAGITEMKGDCYINNSQISWYSSGKVKFSGSNEQTFSGTVAYALGHVILNKAANGITFNQNIKIDSTFTFTKGILTVHSGDTLIFKATSSVIGSSSSSFISGMVKKIGNSVFTFPVGKSNQYRPLVITAPQYTTDSYTAEFITGSSPYGTNADSIANYIFDCDYWTFQRTAGISSVAVNAGWDSLFCGKRYYDNFSIAYWANQKWNGIIPSNITGNQNSGMINNTTTLSTYTALTISNRVCFPIGSVTYPHNTINPDGTVTTTLITDNYNPSDPINSFSICKGSSITIVEDPCPPPAITYAYVSIIDANNMQTDIEIYGGPPYSSYTLLFPSPGLYTVRLKINNTQLFFPPPIPTYNDLFQVNVIDIPNVTISATPGATFCIGQTISLCANTSNTTTPLIYQWSNGASTQCINTQTAGTYTVTVIDQNGCNNTTSISITATGFQSTTTNVTPTCSGLSNGTATIVLTGGQTPFSFSWINSINSAIGSGSTSSQTIQLTTLSAGNYVVTITDHNGCSRQESFNVSTDQPQIDIQGTGAIIQINDFSYEYCNQAGLVATASSGIGPYSYHWTPGNQNTTSITLTGTNNYTCVATDHNGCTTSQTVAVTRLQQNVSSILITGAIYECYSDDDYCINNPVNGVPYSYIVKDLNGNIIINHTNLTTGYCANVSTGGKSFVITFYSNYGTVCEFSNSDTIYACCVGSVNPNAPNTTLTFTDVKVSDLGPLVNTELYGYLLPTTINGISGYDLSSDHNGSCPQLKIAINGTLTVDQNFWMHNGEFLMGPDARILVKSGNILALSDIGYFHSCGEYMWDGIYLENGTQLKGNGGRFYIEDAQNAIVAHTGSIFTINNFVFNKNYRSIVVESSVDNTSAIFSSTLTCVDNICDPQNCYFYNNGIDDVIHLPPFANLRSLSGIETTDITSSLGNSYGLSIGQLSYDDQYGSIISNISCNTIQNPQPCYSNKFHNLDYGIYAYRSDITVINNEFSKIDNPVPIPLQAYKPNPPIGVAICDRSDPSYTAHLKVGDYFVNQSNDNIAKNVFSDCFIGVFAKTNVASNVQFNRFNSITGFGVFIFSLHDQEVVVSNNYFDNCNRGIHLGQLYGSVVSPFMDPVLIENNHYDFRGSLPNGVTLAKQFITVWNTNQQELPLIIQHNTSYNSTYGIRLNGLSGRLYKSIVEDNTIYFPNSPYTFGMYTHNCNNILINQNRFYSIGSTPNSIFPQGISLESSGNIITTENNIFNSGTGIRIFNSNSVFTFQCNWMKDNWDAIHMENSNVGVQGSITHQTDNKWENSINYDVEADLLSTIQLWYVKDRFDPILSALQQSPFGSAARAVMTSVSNPGNRNCDNPCVGNTCRMAKWLEVIKGEGDFVYLDDETKFMTKEMIYKDLLLDSTLINSGTPDDSLLFGFVDSMKTVNSGKFNEVDSLLKMQEFTQAITINNGVNPDYNSDYNQKMLNEIYSNTWAKDIYELDDDQIYALELIAYQNPITGGVAVYSARVMLFIELYDEQQNFNRLASNSFSNSINEEKIVETKENISIKLYPIPARNILNIEPERSLNINGDLCIFNHLGQKMVCKHIMNQIGSLEINIEALSAGIYQLWIKNTDGQIIQKKFIIFK